MTNINEFNITEEELKEIEEITELAQGCTDYFLDSLINPETKEKVELTEEEKKSILKLAIHKTMDYIEENYAKDLNMAVVSNYISMNYSLFSYSFKQYTGSNFVNYLKEIRMREAKKLLTETDMKIIEISQAVGYDNEKHFMKIFKATCGVSPTEYRHNAYLSKS